MRSWFRDQDYLESRGGLPGDVEAAEEDDVTVTGDDALVGRVLSDRYVIGERIARGGMASVFLALDQRLDREVAVKVMHTGLGDDGQFTDRFVREARAAAKLNHRNVVSVFDQGRDGDITYLVMEYVPGRTLRDVMRQEAPMPPLRTMQLTEQILIALSAAHGAKLIHRDIKPENVLISPDGEVKVADFGLARAVSSATTATGGTLIGTVSYLAPEIVLHDGADARSDVYAVGAMMYEMLTGQKPHGGDSPIQVAYKHVHEDVGPPSSVQDGVPDYVDALIARATVRDRDQRSADARVLLQQVRSVRRALEDGLTEDPDLVADLLPRPRATPSAGVSADEPTTSTPTDVSDATVAVALGGGVVEGPEHTVAWDPSDDLAGVAPPTAANKATGLHPPMSPEDYRAMREKHEHPQRGRALLIGAIVAALLVGVLGWWFADGRYTEAPSLVGNSEQEAKTEAESDGFTFKIAERRFSESVEAGVVISTDPGPGDNILPGGTIEAVISKGKDRVTLPEKLKGMTLDEAKAALGELDLVLGEQTRKYDEKVKKDLVIGAVSIEADQQLKRGTVVDLYISDGKKPIDITDFTGKKATDAQASLEKAGFKVKITEKFSDDVAKGIVMSQDPKSGTGHKGDTINLTVSKGPDVVKVPKVTGMKKNKAIQVLEDAGLKAQPVTLGGNPTIQFQTPSEGSTVKRGSTVRIYG